GFPVFRFSGFPVFRFSGFPVFRFSGFPVFRFSGFPVFRFSGETGHSAERRASPQMPLFPTRMAAFQPPKQNPLACPGILRYKIV
ncbi:hypothetical protein, partial [Sinisalibacter aestuarii]|uniref:hypothetical protein n=1 Tax=Sinisalibacter aestuarii TaxID=2949426 RepID=UPI00248F8957